MNPGELWSWVLLLPLGEQNFLQTVFAVPLHYLIILLRYLIIHAFLNPLRSIKMLHLQCGAPDFSFAVTHLFSSFSSSQLTLESQNTSRSPFQCQMVQLGFLGSASHSEEGSHPYGLGTQHIPRDLSHPALFMGCKWNHKHLYFCDPVCAWLELLGPWRHRGQRHFFKSKLNLHLFSCFPKDSRGRMWLGREGHDVFCGVSCVAKAAHWCFLSTKY